MNILATIRAEDRGDGVQGKYLVLKPKYLNQSPTADDSFSTSLVTSFDQTMTASPSRLPPPPYRAPPVVATPPPPPPPSVSTQVLARGPQLEQETETKFKDCIDEFQVAVTAIRRNQDGPPPSHESSPTEEVAPLVPPRKRSSATPLDQTAPDQVLSRPPPHVSPDSVSMYDTMRSVTGDMVVQEMYDLAKSESESKMSVKEATKKFNRIASEEEKTATPSPKRPLADKHKVRGG